MRKKGLHTVTSQRHNRTIFHGKIDCVLQYRGLSPSVSPCGLDIPPYSVHRLETGGLFQSGMGDGEGWMLLCPPSSRRQSPSPLLAVLLYGVVSAVLPISPEP